MEGFPATHFLQYHRLFSQAMDDRPIFGQASGPDERTKFPVPQADGPGLGTGLATPWSAIRSVAGQTGGDAEEMICVVIASSAEYDCITTCVR